VISSCGCCPRAYLRTDDAKALQEDPNRKQQILDRIPAEGWGERNEVKEAVIFLASAASVNVHGTILTVDGGWMA
jgi:2-deoxy-D-gluconate 3-dehydrogenase